MYKIVLMIKNAELNNFTLLKAGSAYNKVALVGELAVPCTCNPLQQG